MSNFSINLWLFIGSLGALGPTGLSLWVVNSIGWDLAHLGISSWWAQAIDGPPVTDMGNVSVWLSIDAHAVGNG